LIEEQAPAGLELLVSAGEDPAYGAFLAIGAGGSGVEDVADVTHRMLPVSDEDVVAALGELRVAGVIAHAAKIRGESGTAPAALVELIGAVAKLAGTRPGIMIEINPVIVPLAIDDPVAADCVVIEPDVTP
jgi:succinyl-CoA synthetase beta subunit